MDIQPLSERIDNLNNVLFDDSLSKNWLKEKFFYRLIKTQDWVEVNFDHSLYNGLDVKNILMTNFNEILNNLKIKKQESQEKECVYHFKGNELYFKLMSDIPITTKKFMYEGKPFLAKTMANYFFELMKEEFYIPIDMSHVFNQKMLLRYIFIPDKSFEDNWAQVIKIKKNENNFLFENDKWKEYLKPHNSWFCVFKGVNDIDLFYNHYTYHPEIQGIGVIQADNKTCWTFTFLKKPEMIELFIKQFHLTAVEYDDELKENN